MPSYSPLAPTGTFCLRARAIETATWLKYGKCGVPRGSLVTCGVDIGTQGAEPISSLSLYVSTGAKLLQKLLTQIGWALDTLRLQYAFDMDDDQMMTAILKSCPKLKQLSIDSNEVNLNRITTVYEQFDGNSEPAISSLTLEKVSDIGSDHGMSFADLLGIQGVVWRGTCWNSASYQPRNPPLSTTRPFERSGPYSRTTQS